MKKISALLLFIFCLSILSAQDRTSFQSADAWSPMFDIRSDVAMVYGVNDNATGEIEARVRGWKDKGYNVQFMTGISWGSYADYFTGKFDGRNHFDEGQVRQHGDTMWHGPNVPYLVPTKDFLKYIKTHVKRAIDAGVTAIYMEEPEFWNRSGYSNAFKREWKNYYGFEWMPQHESANATFLSSKLKHHLYLNALEEVFDFIKTYSKSLGRDVKCYVPTHSLINYAAWEIVSPETSLASLKNMDGYIAQVWTGTARNGIYYNNVLKERIFENAYFEYESMVSMTAPTGKRVYFLTDPVEDAPRTWDYYKKSYEAVFTAQLLFPTVNHYEVMPWPSRIYLGKFKMEGDENPRPIPADYATQINVLINTLNHIPLSKNKLNGTQGIGVMVSNSMMFQRAPTHNGYEDPHLSSFYGMALPLLKAGIPVQTVHMENLDFKNALKDIKVLVLSYSNMKPLQQRYHNAISDWVKRGGVLVYYSRDEDPFQSVTEWWNTNGNNFAAPSQHLFQLLGVKNVKTGDFTSAGKGKLLVVRTDPKDMALTPNGHTGYVEHVKLAYRLATKGKLVEAKNNFILRRGPYIIASVVDESEIKSPLIIDGPVVDLFDPWLPVLDEKVVHPDGQAFLYNLKTIRKNRPVIIAAAARAYNEKRKRDSYSFQLKAPDKTKNAMRLYLPGKPKQIVVSKRGVEIPIFKNNWDAASKTLFLSFENYSEGVDVSITW